MSENENSPEDVLEDALEAYEQAMEADRDNRAIALEDLRFSRLEEQWPSDIIKQREREGRPCLTINKLRAYRQQVVNDARQNKPQIKAHPVDSVADPKTAKVIDGIVRNIEYQSDADVAYDTAVECAVDMGFGYIRVDIDYAHDDTFDLDLFIRRVPNPFAVYGDPASQAADSSDWNTAFFIDRLEKDQFEKMYPDAEKKDWEFDFQDAGSDWFDGEFITVADWWVREEVEKTIYKLSDGTVVDEKRLAEIGDWMFAANVEVVASRKTRGHQVKRHKLSGGEVLSTDLWPGRYIPIVPVYGEEFNVEGRRHYRSLIHSAKDSQRNYNYWRTAATELLALAPKVPFIGPKGSFITDADKWQTANTVSHSFIEFDIPREAVDAGVSPMPQRQPLDSGPAAGAIQEALNASDDIKSILGMFDASMGANGNETSGRAILARQREGDTANFHFVDNLNRAIRHTGRIILDLIPFVYSSERVIRIVGEDGKQEMQPINQQVPMIGQNGQPEQEPALDPMGNPVIGPDGQPQMQDKLEVIDLTVGRYDIVMSSGPSFTTRREETANQMVEVMRAAPQYAQVLAPLLAKNMDWAGADELEELLKANGVPPEVQQQLQQGQQMIQALQAQLQAAQDQNRQLMQDRSLAEQKLQIDAMKAQQDNALAEMRAKLDALTAAQKAQSDQQKNENDRFKAETERMTATPQYMPVELIQNIGG